MRSLILIGLIISATFVQAQDVAPDVQSSRIIQVKPSGFIPYISLNAGYTGNNPNINVEGTPGSIKIIGSYYPNTNDAVFDFGLGYQGQEFTKSGAQDKSISTTIAELAARYQFDSRWQLGGVYNQIFNKGTNYSANQADTEFFGIQFNKEMNLTKQNLARVGGRIMTSLNINGETINMVMLDVSFGWEPIVY